MKKLGLILLIVLAIPATTYAANPAGAIAANTYGATINDKMARLQLEINRSLSDNFTGKNADAWNVHIPYLSTSIQENAERENNGQLMHYLGKVMCQYMEQDLKKTIEYKKTAPKKMHQLIATAIQKRKDGLKLWKRVQDIGNEMQVPPLSAEEMEQLLTPYKGSKKKKNKNPKAPANVVTQEPSASSTGSDDEASVAAAERNILEFTTDDSTSNDLSDPDFEQFMKALQEPLPVERVKLPEELFNELTKAFEKK